MAAAGPQSGPHATYLPMGAHLAPMETHRMRMIPADSSRFAPIPTFEVQTFDVHDVVMTGIVIDYYVKYKIPRISYGRNR